MSDSSIKDGFSAVNVEGKIDNEDLARQMADKGDAMRNEYKKIMPDLIIGTSIQKSVVRRREEFEVLQWVGATRTMIRMPILFEGALLGGASAACALALLACFFWTLQGHLNLNLPFAGLPPPVFFSREIMGGGLATGVGLGILGSFFVTNPVSRNHGA